MQRLIFEYSPLLLVLCAALGVGYAWILYSAKHPWSKEINRLLFVIRTVLVFFLCVLLIGPILKLTNNMLEKPSLVMLIDDSASVGEALSEENKKNLQVELNTAKTNLETAGYDIKVKNLSNEDLTEVVFTGTASDLNGALRTVIGDYESKNLAGIVLLSDGIYNSGSSPLYQQTRIPIYTIGTGDTTERVDIVLKNLAFNKIAYQGNKFTLRAEVLLQGIQNQNLAVSVSKAGKKLFTQTKDSGTGSLVEFDFVLYASEKGTQRYDVAVEVISTESNKRNNFVTAFIEVVEGKKKILVVTPAPHPDIKALRSVIEKNSNYEFILHVPGISTTDPALLQSGKTELVIFYDVLDYENKTRALLDQLSQSRSSLLYIIGSKTNTRQLAANGIPITFESPGQWDAVTPVINSEFQSFGFLENTAGIFARYPPADVPFGKFTYPPNAKVLLYQRIGSVSTDRPLVFTWEDGDKKIAAIAGHQFWRWRLNEFAEKENSEFFDDVFSKLIQYLSTLEDKRKFRSFPIQNEFAEGSPVTIESQVYNDLFELVYGNSIDLQVRDEKGQQTIYNYITSPGNSRYRIGGLKEGVYQFSASTVLNGKKEIVAGQFVIKSQNVESQNLTADHGLLRKISENSGGQFYKDTEWNKLIADFSSKEATSIIRSEESFNPLINLKMVFFLLLLLISAEWFLRKYMGGY